VTVPGRLPPHASFAGTSSATVTKTCADCCILVGSPRFVVLLYDDLDPVCSIPVEILPDKLSSASRLPTQRNASRYQPSHNFWWRWSLRYILHWSRGKSGVGCSFHKGHSAMHLVTGILNKLFSSGQTLTLDFTKMTTTKIDMQRLAKDM
jgi:hypothetical protein